MCILFLYVNHKPSSIGGYKLIIAANRDEFYARPALPAAQWLENSNVIGGRDLEPGRENGTWLAISNHEEIIKFSALLNITGAKHDTTAVGRGFLVNDFVTSDSNVRCVDYCDKITNTDQPQRNGFNLITVEILKDEASVYHCSNIGNDHVKKWPENTCLGFGNSPPVSPLVKVQAGQLLFENIVNKYSGKDELINGLLEMLKKTEKHWPDNELRTRAPQWGELLSSINVNISAAGYGSRTHTIILINDNDEMDFIEETMTTKDPNGPWKKTAIRRQLKLSKL